MTIDLLVLSFAALVLSFAFCAVWLSLAMAWRWRNRDDDAVDLDVDLDDKPMGLLSAVSTDKIDISEFDEDEDTLQ